MHGRKSWLFLLFIASMFGDAGRSAAEQDGFPFDKELLLDVSPMRGSKRIPNMEVFANGAVVLEMWCNRVEGRLIVAGDTVTVLTGAATARQCPEERARADSELLTSLAEVTNWRRQDSIVTFIGPRTLRFRLLTN
jgi:heat shock protein HslJ